MAYTTINKSTDNFNTKLYTGNGGANSITGVGFQPDLVWMKNRSTGLHHVLQDAVRGTTKAIYSNLTAAEETQSGSITAFASDGFTFGSGTMADVNGNGNSFASWNWKAGGSGSANTDGSVNSTVSVNTTAGFSVVKYVGDGAMTTTVGHGLGVVPKVILIKNLQTATNWTMYHHSLGNTGQMYLDTTNSFTTDADTFKNTTPTSTLWTMSNSSKTNQGTKNHIAYCFAEKPGYSKFGSWTSNNSADGTFVYTGFAPSFVILKESNGTNQWVMYDNKRPSYNQTSNALFANANSAEATDLGIDILSNGYKIRATNNQNTGNYIYMAFGQSLVGSNNVPCTAR